MIKSIRFVMVGGFLGAGKTTTVGRLARHYQEQGLSVGIVTNDQATDLVDTNTLRGQGYDVGEVAGACFCCNFNELLSTMEKLGECQQPDVILAEPVGSCTDLVATVIQPIKQLYEARFSVAPYAVILKPSHGSKILKGEAGTGFSPKAAYILEKQLEEADVVLVNRIDELQTGEVEELQALVQAKYPGTPVLRVSARTGTGFEALTEFLAQDGDFGRKILEIDYDTYAEGEAELGWLNSSLRFSAPKPFALDEVLLEIIARLQQEFELRGAEPAHLKTIGLWEGFYGVANLISSQTVPELSLPSRCQVLDCDLVVNARVALAPELLAETVRKVVQEIAAKYSAAVEFRQTQSFRPGRPVPTHRYSEAV